MTRSGAAPIFAAVHKAMRTYSVPRGNCASDTAVTRQCFPNAMARGVRVPYDEATYYRLGYPVRQG
jgi:hypothetical protein